MVAVEKARFVRLFQRPCGRVLGVHRSGSLHRPADAGPDPAGESGHQNHASSALKGRPYFSAINMAERLMFAPQILRKTQLN